MANGKIVWDLKSQSKEMFDFTKKNLPWVATQYDRLIEQIPLVETCATFKNDTSFRPALHNRAYYLSGPNKDVISIKGTEIFAKDLPEALERARNHRITATSMALTEHFPICEQKVPLALHLPEAEEEAISGLNFQLQYLKRYGELARMPLPLVVVKWPDEATESFKKLLSPLLSPYANETAMRIIDKGLASICYYYPGMPNRVRDLTNKLGAIKTADGFAKRQKELETLTDPSVTISRWIKLVVQILGLGYFPVTMSHLFIGQCIQPQNAVIDGGFVDCDSLQPMSNVTNDHDFYETFMTVQGWISFSVQEFILGMGCFTPYFWHVLLENNKTNFFSSFVASHVWTEFRRAADEERKKGVKFDPRIERLLDSKDLYSEITTVLRAVYPGTHWSHAGPWM